MDGVVMMADAHWNGGSISISSICIYNNGFSFSFVFLHCVLREGNEAAGKIEFNIVFSCRTNKNKIKETDKLNILTQCLGQKTCMITVVP